MKRFRAVLFAAMLVVGLGVPLAAAPSAEAHGWVTSPPSRQDHCSTGSTSFDCGAIKYEPQSVEAPKGSMQCSGGNAAFAILDDSSRPWPVTNVGRTVTFRWRLTAAHSTSTWEYFVDGVLHRTFSQGGQQPPSTVSHVLEDLPEGRHTILARWNIADTPMAFYSCVDVQVGEGGPSEPGPGEPGPGTPGECSAPAWQA